MTGFVYHKDNWTLDVEGYVKELDGITTLSDNFVSLPNQPFSEGKSRIRGIDVLLKRRVGRYRSWLSYTLSQVLYEFPSLGPKAIPATHDQTHTIQWVNIYKRGPWELSMGLQIKTGVPTTLAIGIIEKTIDDKTRFVIDYEPINSSRLDPYSKVDASIIYNFGNKQKFHGFIGFSIQNLFNTSNILGRQYLIGDLDAQGAPQLITIEQQDLKVTPNLSVNIQF